MMKTPDAFGYLAFSFNDAWQNEARGSGMGELRSKTTGLRFHRLT